MRHSPEEKHHEQSNASTARQANVHVHCSIFWVGGENQKNDAGKHVANSAIELKGSVKLAKAGPGYT